jgi:hypothetical protein
MKKTIGWIETIIGILVTIGGVVGLLAAKAIAKIDLPESITIPVEGASDIVINLSEAAAGLTSAAPMIAVSYFMIVLLIGILFLLEGLAKLGSKTRETNERN